jgi:hypothetical protein
MFARKPLFLAFAALMAAGAGCSSERSTSPSAPSRLLGLGGWGSTSPKLLVCPSSTTQTATGVIDALGGTLTAGGMSVVIPANAVLAPTSFTLTVPASQYVEIEVTAGGADHYVFVQPVVVILDYSRCGGGSLLSAPHQAWNIDPETKALLENMGGVDSKLTHQVSFSTIHFSGFAIAD